MMINAVLFLLLQVDVNEINTVKLDEVSKLLIRSEHTKDPADPKMRAEISLWTNGRQQGSSQEFYFDKAFTYKLISTKSKSKFILVSGEFQAIEILVAKISNNRLEPILQTSSYGGWELKTTKNKSPLLLVTRSGHEIGLPTKQCGKWVRYAEGYTFDGNRMREGGLFKQSKGGWSPVRAL